MLILQNGVAPCLRLADRLCRPSSSRLVSHSSLRCSAFWMAQKMRFSVSSSRVGFALTRMQSRRMRPMRCVNATSNAIAISRPCSPETSLIIRTSHHQYLMFMIKKSFVKKRICMTYSELIIWIIISSYFSIKNALKLQDNLVLEKQK